MRHWLIILTVGTSLLTPCTTVGAQVPANAYVSGDRWFCNNGFKRVGDRCEQLLVPANAYASGDRWFCNNGFKKVGDRCEQLQIPANAYASGDRWFCNNGFKRVGDRCEQLLVPANAYVSGDRWFCNNGFKRIGDRCEQLLVPVNAYVSGDRWFCNNGFKKVGEQCLSLAVLSPESTSGARTAGRTTSDRQSTQTSKNSHKPSLEHIPTGDRTMIEAACNGERLVAGPAAYYGCLDEQLAALNQVATRPSLHGVSVTDRTMIESACNGERLVAGPAVYYGCLDEQLTALNQVANRPSLHGVSVTDRTMIESACNGERLVAGPAASYGCLDEQVAALNRVATRPSFQGVSVTDRTMIESACNGERLVAGPAAYYECLAEQIASLGSRVNPGTTGAEASLTAIDVAPLVAGPSVNDKRRSESDPSRFRNTADSSAPVEPTGILASKSPPAVSIVVPRATTSSPGDSPSWLPWLLLLLFVGGAARLLKTAPKCRTCSAPTSRTDRLCDVCAQQEAERIAREAAAQESERQRQAEAQRKEQARRDEEKRRRIRTLEDLGRMSGREFEEFIGSLFERDGYRVQKCGGSGDEGVDLILEMGNARDVVQCKRWKADIGSPVIRDFYGALMHADARHGFVITTASFSQSARDFARGKPITLIAGIDILNWIDHRYSSQRRQDSRRARSDAEDRSKPFDPYEVLGVRRGATQEEIRAAYRDAMAKYHPDKVAHLGPELQELAKKKAQELNRAYSALRSKLT